MGGTIEVLTADEIVETNYRLISAFGGMPFAGEDNLINPGSLAYILEAIQGPLYGGVLYPTLIDKVAAVAWWIITRHVFYDGNKRTAIEVCRAMLDLNGYTMRIDSEVIAIAVSVAQGQLSFPQFVSWLGERVEPR